MAENGGDLTPEQTEKLLQFQDLSGIDDIERCREILERNHWDIEVAVQLRFSEEDGQAFVYSTVFDLFKFVLRLLRPDPRRYITDPLRDVTNFIQSFESSYGAEHPNFYHNTYSQALNDAKRDLRFLLVYLHGDDHEDTTNFCKMTLCSQQVVNFVNTNFLFWACNTNSPEGYRVSQALRENTYPFLALIVLRNNRMTVVARIEGPVGAEDLMTRLGRIMEDNEGSLIAARADREERNFNQSLRAEQDEAYQASLRADQEKERRKRQEVEAKDKEVQDAIDRQMEEVRRVEEIRQRKERLRECIPSEPDSDNPDAINIVLKLPNGIRLERRFLKHQSLEHLYNYVFVHEAAPDDFQIISNFPRKMLPCQPTEDNPCPPSFENVGLGKKEMLFVHDNEA
ncbi:FAS-associated factor 2 [Lamellibrachia satsuma]|nr:FAS-associated factor 2 [Lamellibrachia satsuma]